jgi:hypothetical protein
MQLYCGNLVYFPIIPSFHSLIIHSSFSLFLEPFIPSYHHHSYRYLGYFWIYWYPFNLGSLSLKKQDVRLVCMQKKRVVRPVSILSRWRTIGNCFPYVLRNSYRSMRLYVWAFIEAQEGKWGNRRTVEQRRGTLPGVG